MKHQIKYSVGDGLINSQTKQSITIVEVFEDGYGYVYDYINPSIHSDEPIDSRCSNDPLLLQWELEMI